ncbi:MAG: alpha/beta fold hydrolase, partial [Chromatiales bacterium]|nr:alpha/beta fold hydrolase [Chromatiales bacterium]
QRAAVIAPERIKKLVLVASNPKFVQGDNWDSAMPERTLRQFAAALLKNPAQTLERFLSLQVKGDDQARQTLRLLRQDVASRPEADALALEHGLEFLLEVDLRDQLSSISCPTLWLLGERDTLVPVAVGDELEALMPEADVLILNGASHAPFLSHPEVAVKTMKHFLDADA